jgi:hypothetical protein
MQVSVDVDEGGLPVAVKVASTDDERRRLHHQARALGLVARPGVVRLLDHDIEAGHLVTAWQPGSPLSSGSIAAKPLVQQLQYMADTAALIDAIHLDGWSHGSLDSDHVIVTSTDTVVICGFGDAVFVEDDSDGHGHTVRRDVEALVSMVRRLADEHLRLRPTTSRLLRLPGRTATPARPSWLIELDTRWSRSPNLTAHEVARSLTAALPRVVTARPAARRRVPIPAGSSRRIAIGAAAIAGVIAGALMLRAIAPLGGSSAAAQPTTPPTLPRPIPAVPIDSVPSSTVPPTTVPPTTVPPTTLLTTTVPPTTVPPTTVPPTTVPIDPCALCLPDARIDGVITVDGRTYRLSGDADDIVVMGDWDCDGTATPAVLHRPSGNLDRFDHWATDGATAEAVRVDTDPAAIGVSGDPDCGPPHLVVTDGTNSTPGAATDRPSP